MTKRCFRTNNESLYESVRMQLDAAWGLADHGSTCITPAADAPRDASGAIVLCVDSEFCEYAEVASMLPQLLSSGAVEEITEAQYMAALPQPSLP